MLKERMIEYATKQELRDKILTILRNQKEEDRLAKSLMIQDKLFEMREFRKSGTVLFYASFDGEVDTFEMMKKAKKIGKKIGLPVVVREKNKIMPTFVEYLDNLQEGVFGIKQPTERDCKPLGVNEIDMVIVPGIAFDKAKNRLGRGGGYYDRFLCTLPSHISTVGLAFDFQMIDHIPQQKEHDFPVSHVLVN